MTAVLSLADGVAVCGRLGADLVAAHYDFKSRRVAVHVFDSPGPGTTAKFVALPDLECVAMRRGKVCIAVDLATGGRYPNPMTDIDLVTTCGPHMGRPRRFRSGRNT